MVRSIHTDLSDNYRSEAPLPIVGVWIQSAKGGSFFNHLFANYDGGFSWNHLEYEVRFFEHDEITLESHDEIPGTTIRCLNVDAWYEGRKADGEEFVGQRLRVYRMALPLVNDGTPYDYTKAMREDFRVESVDFTDSVVRFVCSSHLGLLDLELPLRDLNVEDHPGMPRT